ERRDRTTGQQFVPSFERRDEEPSPPTGVGSVSHRSFVARTGDDGTNGLSRRSGLRRRRVMSERWKLERRQRRRPAFLAAGGAGRGGFDPPAVRVGEPGTCFACGCPDGESCGGCGDRLRVIEVGICTGGEKYQVPLCLACLPLGLCLMNKPFDGWPAF